MTVFKNRSPFAAKLLITVATCALIIPLSVSLSACNRADNVTPAASTTVGKEVDDTITTARVKSALMADDQIKSLDFKVATHHGEVVLSGFAENQTQIDRALSVAGHTEGAKIVTNQLTLKEGKQTVGNKIDDTVVTASVKSALLADPTTKSRDIAVVTRKGEVQLSGFLDDDIQVAHAEDVVRRVEGVEKIVNHLSVKK